MPIPGQQQEGLAFDAAGALWIADDKDKSILRIKDAGPGGRAAPERAKEAARTEAPEGEAAEVKRHLFGRDHTPGRRYRDARVVGC